MAAPLALLCATAPVHAQEAAKSDAVPAAVATIKARPALWVVNDADTTIYLFGTIHLLPPNIDWLDGPMKTAFDRADELVLEIADNPDPATQVKLLQTGIDLAAQPLAERLPEDVRAKYVALIADTGLPLALVNQMKPWLAAVTLTTAPLKKLGYDVEKGVEPILRTAAKAQGKSIGGLETAEEQIGIFGALDPALQMRLLIETINEQPELEKTINQMISSWSAGDALNLAAAMNKSTDQESGLAKPLLYDRNARWANWIKARLDKPGTVFLAVGAGHLAGKNSVQDALLALNIKTESIKTR